MHRISAVVRNLVPIGVVAALVTCGDDPVSTRRPPVLPPSFEFVASDPVRFAGAAPAPSGSAAAARLQQGDSITWVSLPVGTVPGGRSAAIRNLSNDFLATADVVDGGFDPLPLPAGVGDSVEVVITDGSGGTTRAALRVPARRPPIIVRTVPPSGGTDIPLNSLIRVVFSEPMDPRSITTGTLRLLKGGTPVAGRVEVSGDGLRADFVPDSLLVPEAAYRLVLAASVADLSGDMMGQGAAVDFTTGSAPAASVAVFPSTVALAPGDTVRLAATPKDAAGSALTGRAVAWSSSDSAVARVSASGLVTGVTVGSATVTAIVEQQRGTATVRVTAPAAAVESVLVIAPRGPIPVGDSVQVVVVLRDANGTFLEYQGRTVTWSSSDSTIATISTFRLTSGLALVTGVDSGTVTITATSEGKRGTADIAVRHMGSLMITTVTTGVDLDPDGYFIGLQANPEIPILGPRRIALNQTITVGPLWLGNHFIWLADVDPNCSVPDDLPTVNVAPRTVTQVTFTVTCAPRSTLDGDGPLVGVWQAVRADFFLDSALSSLWGSAEWAEGNQGGQARLMIRRTGGTAILWEWREDYPGLSSPALSGGSARVDGDTLRSSVDRWALEYECETGTSPTCRGSLGGRYVFVRNGDDLVVAGLEAQVVHDNSNLPPAWMRLTLRKVR